MLPITSATQAAAQGPKLPAFIAQKAHWNYLRPDVNKSYPDVTFVSFKNPDLFDDMNTDKSTLAVEIMYFANEPKSKIVLYLPDSYWRNNNELRTKATESVRYLHDELQKNGGKLVLVITDKTFRNTAIGASYNAASTGDEAAKIALGQAQVQVGGGSSSSSSSSSSFQPAHISSPGSSPWGSVKKP